MQHWNYTMLRRTAATALLTACWAFCANANGQQAMAAGDPSPASPPASVQKLVRGHWSEKPEIMRNNHQTLLRDGMNNGARSTTRKDDATIERCVTCHIVRDEQGKALTAADPRHFCRSCHAQQRVSVNCFTCHASLPVSDPATMDPMVRNADSLKTRLQEWQKHQQGGTKK